MIKHSRWGDVSGFKGPLRNLKGLLGAVRFETSGEKVGPVEAERYRSIRLRSSRRSSTGRSMAAAEEI